MEEKIIPCELCGRGCTREQLTKHHALPRSEGGTMEHVELICHQCHSMVHQTFANETLAKLYPTMEILRKAIELEGYIRWVRKQPVTRRTKNAPRNRKI